MSVCVFVLLPISQLYLCHATSLSVHGYISPMLNGGQRGTRAALCGLIGVRVCVCVCASLSSRMCSCNNPMKLSENDSFIILYESGTNGGLSLYRCKYGALTNGNLNTRTHTHTHMHTNPCGKTVKILKFFS